MGAGASTSKKKKDKAAAAAATSSGKADDKRRENKVDSGANGVGKVSMDATAADRGDKTVPEDDDDSEAVEGVEDIICRLAQAHPTQSPRRWESITQKLNRTMRKKKISGQPLKALLAKEGLCIPQRWVVEREQAEQDRARARLQKPEEKVQGGFGSSLFGKKKTPAAAPADKKQLGETAEDGIEMDDSDEAGETDTEFESDDEEGATAEQLAGSEEGPGSGYKRCSLSKYEVFSLMRRVHDRAGAGVTEAEDVAEEMERAGNMVGLLYEHLPAKTLKEMSQQNRIKSNLRQDSLVYGEMDLGHFLKVMVKLKRVHGHMMSKGGSFWDLGAGSGKMVIAAAMMHNFETAYGVECLEDLRAASRPILDRWRKEEAAKVSSVKEKIRVDFIFADAMKQAGWVSEATLLFVHTNLSAKNLIQLREKAGLMKVGAICLSVSLSAVDDEKWGLLAVEPVNTSWGSTKLYIHEKLVA
eukprot:g16898.t1